MRNFLKLVRDGWTILGATLLLMIATEGAARVALKFRHRGPMPPASAASELKNENQLAAHTQWVSYVYWRIRNFAGNYFNIDERGIRRTVQTPATEKAQRIFVFGGSTVWGSEVSDADTVPSQLAKHLAGKSGTPVEITNFGQPGYVSTQEGLSLLFELRSGNIPDVAIFYDGINDAHSSFQNQVAGIPQNEQNRRAEFNQAKNFTSIGVAEPGPFAFYLHRHSALVQWFFPQRELLVKSEMPAWRAEAAERLSQETARLYFENIKIADTLSKKYGVVNFHFWQPSLYTKLPLAPKEKKVFFDEVKHFGPDHPRFIGLVNQKIADWRNKPANFFDLQNVFAGDGQSYFRDFCHVDGKGNARIAKAISDKLNLTSSRWLN